MSDPGDAGALYRRLITCWNDSDASGFGEAFTSDGSMVGFDGIPIESRDAIVDHLRAIFADHQPAKYLAKVREIRPRPEGRRRRIAERNLAAISTTVEP